MRIYFLFTPGEGKKPVLSYYFHFTFPIHHKSHLALGTKGLIFDEPITELTFCPSYLARLYDIPIGC